MLAWTILALMAAVAVATPPTNPVDDDEVTIREFSFNRE